MNGCLERFGHKQLVVRSLIRWVHTASPPGIEICALQWILCSLNDVKVM